MPDRLRAGRFVDAGRTLVLIGISRAETAGRVLQRVPVNLGAQVEARLPDEIASLGKILVAHAGKAAQIVAARVDAVARSRTPDDSH